MQPRPLNNDRELSAPFTLAEIEQVQELLRSFRSHSKSRRTSMEPLHPESLMEEIRRRAHELYEERGREPGLADQDWLRAEAEILAHRRAHDRSAAA